MPKWPKSSSNNPHNKITLTHGAGTACESCHGPGKAHVEGGGDVTKIKQLAKMTPAQVSETCLGCHAGTHPNFQRSPHAKAGVGCTSCHSVHAGDTEAKLLKASQPAAVLSVPRGPEGAVQHADSPQGE